MTSNFSDDARRADILRRAHAGLEEDLDDMRAELMDILPDYEQRLRQASDALPSWLDVTPAQVRALFHLRPVAADTDSDTDASPVHGILGPRTVALAAGRIEEFIDEGFVDADFNDDTRTLRLGELYSETSQHLDGLIREARRVAAHASTTLDAWLDAHLFELERQRKTDVEALEELVGQGDIGRGDSARQEIADLWEDQRRRAAYLQASWHPLTALLREGQANTEAGLEELSELLMRARAGLIGSNPAIEALLEPFEWPAAPVNNAPLTSAESSEADDAGPTLDLSRPSESQRTAPIETAPTETAPTETAFVESASDAQPPPESAADKADTPDEFAPESTYHTHPEGSCVPGIIPLDEPTSDADTTTLESSSVSDYSEPSSDDTGAGLDIDAPRTTTQRMYTRTETPSTGHPTAPAPQPRRVEPTPAPAEELPTPAESAATGSRSDEATYTQCFRIRPGYKRAGLAEILTITLPPTLVLVGMALLSVMHLAGAAFNPFAQWPWAFSAVTAAVAWLLLLPALRRWRTKWLGTKLVIMRHTDVREEASLRFDTQALSLDDATWRWDRLNLAELRRWDSPLDEVCGWSLAISAPNAPPLRLATPESNRKKWQNSPYQLVETPYDAWQVSPYDFDTIARRAL